MDDTSAMDLAIPEVIYPPVIAVLISFVRYEKMRVDAIPEATQIAARDKPGWSRILSNVAPLQDTGATKIPSNE